MTKRVFFGMFLTLFSLRLLAQPTGVQVMSGSVQIQPHGKVLEIAALDRSIIHWNDFSIQKDEITRFIQPNEAASVLNCVIGIYPSMIEGILESNGRVILVNPNGVMISKDAVIHSSDFIASTCEVLDVKEWTVHFEREGSIHFQKGAVINHEGTIQATGVESQGGRVLLVADAVHMKGTIEAPQGTVEIYGNDLCLQEKAIIDVSADFGGGTIQIGDDFPASITAIGPSVQLHADGGGEGDGGCVILWGGESMEFHGQVTAFGGEHRGDGGFVEVSSKGKMVFDGHVDTRAVFGKTGELLLDPVDITIMAGGALPACFNSPAANTIYDNTLLGGVLGGCNVTIQTSGGVGGTGNITVVDAVGWGAATSLTLIADNSVFVNNDIAGGGDIFITALNGDINVQPITGLVNITNSSLVRMTAAGDINFLGPGFINVGLFGTDVEMFAGGDVLLNFPPVVNTTILIQTFAMGATPISIDAGGSVIMGPATLITSESGPVTIIADQDIRMLAGSAIFYFTAGAGVIPNPVTLVVDDQAPIAPLIGNGVFYMEAGAMIGDPAAASIPVQIFTAIRNNNTILGIINGVNFNPGPYGIDTNTERWRVYYPNPFLNPGFPFFTIFYKEPVAIFTPLAQTIGQAFIVLEEFAYPPAFYEDHFCVTECPNAIDPNRVMRKECPWIQIDNYRKFYPNRQKYITMTSDSSPVLQSDCEEK